LLLLKCNKKKEKNTYGEKGKGSRLQCRKTRKMQGKIPMGKMNVELVVSEHKELYVMFPLQSRGKEGLTMN